MALTRLELIAMTAMVLGVVMDGLDSSIINIAVPVIAESFGTDTNAVAWVTIVYFAMNAGLMLAFGRIADTGHIRKIYVSGFIIFGIGSLMCGLSGSLGFMIFTRIVQGLGAAMLAAVAPMFCVKFLPATKLGLGMAFLSVGGAIGFGVGPAIGGFIIELASWHWAFFINIPVAIIGILIVLRGLPKDTATGRANLDMTGTGLMFAAVLCGVLALELFSYPGYGTMCICLATAMLVLLLAFVKVEKKVKFPMLNIKMFGDWRFISLASCYLFVNLCYMGVFYIIPFYMTKAVGLDTLTVGLILLIPSILSGILTLPIGRYCDSHGRRPMALVCVTTLVIVMILYATADPSKGWIGLLPAFIGAGVMWGVIGPSVCSRIIDVARPEDKGMASTMTNFLYYCGGTIGTALFAALLTFGAGAAGIPVELMSVESFMQGYYFAMVFAIAISFIAVFTTWVVKEDGIRTV